MGIQEIQQLPRDEADYVSPTWHENVLKETAQRLAEGHEQVLDWDQAKAGLRNRAL